MSAFVVAQTSSQGSGLTSLIFLAVMVGIFYLLILRPQRNRAKQQQVLISELTLGDDVQTIGGIKGVVRAIDDDSVVIEVESGRLRVAKRAIASRGSEEN